MDKDRIKGAAQQAKGAINKAVGKVTGDAKLKTEGEMDTIEGKRRNAVGGVKDALRQQDQQDPLMNRACRVPSSRDWNKHRIDAYQ